MQQRMRRKTLKRRQPAMQPAHRGTSLVEVLVVLAILTIGIFAIIRIFPEGFVSIKGSGNSTKAQGLTDVLTDYLRKHNENLPIGIAAVNPTSPGQIAANVHPLDMQSNFNYIDNPTSTGAVVADPRFSQFNKGRAVIGETLKIPAPTANFLPRASYSGPGNLGVNNSEALVSAYHVLFAPLYTLDPYPAANNAARGIAVYSATPHQRVVFQNPPTVANDDELRSRDLFGYGINYQLGRLLFTAANQNARFKCEFAYDNGAGNILRGSIDIVVPAATTAWGGFSYYTVDLVTLGVLPAGAEVYPGSDVLYRYFDRIGVDVAFNVKNDSTPTVWNPFEFKVYDRVSGLFGFNPEAATTPLPSREGRGLSARIDYDVDDWQILHQDIEVPRTPSDPGGTFYATKLFTNRIKKLGQFEEEAIFPTSSAGNGPVDVNNTYQGLMRYYPASAMSAARTGTPDLEVVIVDLATGLQIDNRTLQIGGNNSNGELNHSLGVIQFRPVLTFQLPYDMGSTPVAPVIDVRGRTLRVFFRHMDHFAMAVEKPYSGYSQEFSLPALGAGEFFQAPLGYLLFPLADAEKTVAVDYLWRDATTGEQRRDIGEMLRVKLPDPGGVEDPGANTAWVRVANADCGTGNCNPDVEPASIRVIGVRGVSIRTHVAWREAPRWRHLRRTAMLTREVTR